MRKWVEQMNNIIKFELKKIITNKISWVSIIFILGFIVTFIAASLSSVYSYDENGGELNGFAAISRENQLTHPLAGEVTLETISNVISKRQELTDKGAKDVSEEEYGVKWHKYQGFNQLICYAYAKEANTFDYYVIDTLIPEDGEQFYSNRTKKVNQLLDMDYTYGNYTLAEKEYFLNMNEKVKIPLYYDYNLGWQNLLMYLPTFCLLLSFVMCTCIAPVFSNEYQTKTDSVIFSSKYGRTKVFSSKIKASFIFSTLLYMIATLILSLTMLGIFGFEGFNSNLQINDFIAPYNVTMLQAYFITIGLGYLAYLSLMTITLFISTKMKSNFGVIIISAVVLFIPTLIPHSRTFRLINYIVDLFPSKIMNGLTVLRSYKLYNIFGILVPQPWVMVAVSVLLSCVMIFFAHNSYKKHQVENS